jgi:hypothetical protein
VTAPGFHPRGSVVYDEIDAVNFSTLKELAVSPKRYRYRLDNPKPQTKPMAFGVAIHTAVLEPERFGDEYVMFTGKQKRGKKWDAFKAENAGKKILTRAEYVEAARVRDAVRADPVAMQYLERGEPEVAMVWEDEETGTLCKGRMDWRCADPDHVLVDLKSARSIEAFMFGRSGGRLLYHMQTSFYADGFKALTGTDPTFKVVSVEQEPPHDVAVYNMPAEVSDLGRDEYRSLLVKLKFHRERDEWPGYANGCELDFNLPPWMMGDDDELSDLGLEL